MSDLDSIDPTPRRPRSHRTRWVVLGGGLLVVALATLALSSRSAPPAEIAADPVLVRGYEIYSTRCASCHGMAGRGDGPLARNLAGPAPRNLVEDRWKYGDAPEQVLAVLEHGTQESTMPAYGRVYGRTDLNDVAAYVYHLTGRAVPAKLRVR